MNVASLHAHGMVDHIVDERPDAAVEGRAFCQRMAQAIEHELAALSASRVAELLPRRIQKYRRLGVAFPAGAAAADG